MDETANIVDEIASLGIEAKRVAHAITADGIDGYDATGGTVASLTEAVMGITAGLLAVAASIDRLAEAVMVCRD